MLAEFKELFQLAIQGANLPITVLFILMILYWVSVILGALDIDLFTIDLDLDTEASVDLDADGDFDTPSTGTYQGMLLYFNIGTVPVTIWLSLLIFVCWSLSMFETYTVNGSGNILLAIALAIPNLIIGMYAAKWGCQPLKKIFASMEGTAVTNHSLIGQRAKVTSSTVSQSFGLIELKSEGAPITMNARTHKDIDIPKGSTVVLVQESEPGTFLVEPLNP